MQAMDMKGRNRMYATALQKLISRFSNVPPSPIKFDDGRRIMEWIMNERREYGEDAKDALADS